MAIVKGVNEIVHLPLYDSLFVRPGKHLGDLVSANVLKFFVNIQGKTKLETNMQSSSLLPHWNTFEARALRVVISDLPEMIAGSNGNGNGHRHDLPFDWRDFELLWTAPDHGLKPEQVVAAQESLTAYRQAVENAKTISKDFDECLGLLRRFCDQDHMGRILKLQGELRAVRKELATVLTRTKVKVEKPDALSHFSEALGELDATGEERYLEPKLDRAIECLNELSMLTDLGGRIKGQDLAGLDACVAAAEKLVNAAPVGVRQANLRQRFEVFVRELAPPQARRRGLQLLGQLLYNSVTTLFVGEKIMIQMPTWFFPAGAGPYAENGEAVTNGFPTPQATFNFAEPVIIDTQQHFRVELEIPEADAFQDFKSINGPFFIWVVLDGYMKRDVQ